MKTPDADVAVDVDLRNPAQFFACCGLLELVGRLWPESEGWFDDVSFHVATYPRTEDSVLAKTIHRVVEAEPLVGPAGDAAAFGDKIAPLVLLPFNLRLDWWLKPGGAAEAGPFKLWSGQQKPSAILNDLQKALRRLDRDLAPDLFSRRVPLTGRFGFDPASAWEAIDVGFSPNEQNMPVLTAPAAELFAAVGLQSCRPHIDRREVTYTAWRAPLPLIAARAAAAGALGGALDGRRFRYHLASRGDYKAFGYADEIQEVR